MRKSVSPTVAILIIVLVVLLAVVLLMKMSSKGRVYVQPGRGPVDPRTGRSLGARRQTGGSGETARGGQRGGRGAGRSRRRAG